MLLKKIYTFINNYFFEWRINKKILAVGIVISKSGVIFPRVLKKVKKQNKVIYKDVLEKNLEYSFDNFNEWGEKILEIEDIDSAIYSVNIRRSNVINMKSSSLYLKDILMIERFYQCPTSKFYIK